MIIITRITAVKRTHGCNSLLLGSGRARAQWQHGEGGGFGGQLPWHRIEGARGGGLGMGPLLWGGILGWTPPYFQALAVGSWLRARCHPRAGIEAWAGS